MPNRLAGETSPYLLQHADNPVDWFPWSNEALTAAREQDRPIFLSLGYAACHWCHVMAHESFEDPETADLMNQHFINIKVDREERPDLDTLYMDAVVALTGQGGWPMSVFLTPEGRPFYGGTYFPPVRRHNLPSFKEVLTAIVRLWQGDRKRALETGLELARHLAAGVPLASSTDHLDPSAIDRTAQVLFQDYDWVHGGWGGAPKFPQASAIEFLLQTHARSGDRLALDMAVHALERMSLGGIYDHVAGGFHRYSVDAGWTVPHFEKMLYDNALLSRAYLHAWQATASGHFRRVAEETLDFLLRDMRHPAGGFFSSYDADSEGHEGRYYVWTKEEFRQAIEDDRTFEGAVGVFPISDTGNFEGRNILARVSSDRQAAAQLGTTEVDFYETLAEIRRRLAGQRSRRTPPALDDKVLAAWNGLLLASLADASRALRRPDYLDAAQRLAGFLLRELRRDGRWLRSWRNGHARFSAYLDDLSALGDGLLALYQADHDTRWYRAAHTIADEILERFQDPSGGFFDTATDHEQLIARPKTLQDTPIPSGNSLAAGLLLRIAAYEGNETYSSPAHSMLLRMQETASRHPASFSSWLCAMDFALGPVWQLGIVGNPRSNDFMELADTASAAFYPRLVVAGGHESDPDNPALLNDRPARNGKATAYLCQTFNCQLPTTSPSQLSAQLREAFPSAVSS